MEKNPLFPVICSGLLAVILLVGIVVMIPKEEDQPKVAVVLKTGSEQYWKMVEMGARKAFQDFGIDGEIVVAPLEYNEYEQQQLNMLKRALNKNPDALIVAPNEASAIPILEEYTKKSIPVLMVDTDIGWDKQEAFIGTDNSILGEKSAELLISMLQPGDKVVILGGSAYDPVVIERIKGAKQSFKAAGIKVLVERYDIGKLDLSKSAMETVLETTPEIDGVFASSDEVALGALK
ncbi:MAG TPA: sugar ABC transporter substrate-binding protein, partial [Bacillus sp. (in: firmicutes)]|nr:sugar ABC transporter substrate-binding protein [Bacillus sp. (in: firmicutes)]